MSIMVYLQRKPFTYKILMMFLIINILFMSVISTRYQRAHAIIPLIALTAPQILGLGTLAIASGLAFTKPETTQALLQDMYSKGRDLIDLAINTMTDTNISISQALWDWLKGYALNDATTFEGTTMQYMEPATGAWTTPTTLNVNTVGISPYSMAGIGVTQGTIKGQLYANASLSSSIRVKYITKKDVVTGTITYVTAPLLNQTRQSFPYKSRLYLGSTMLAEMSWIENEGYNITLDISENGVITYYSGAELPENIVYQSVSLNYTDANSVLHRPFFDYAGDWNASGTGAGIIGFTYLPLGAIDHEVAVNTMVGTGDLVINPPWAKDAALGAKDVALPIPLTGATDITTAVTAVTGVIADTLTYTYTGTTPSQPYIPPASPGLPKIPWYAFFSYFLDLLRAMIEYVVRLSAFLLTMQSIGSIGVGEYSEVFSWVRNHSWGGINVYNVIVSLALLSMSLLIFKVVRKL